MGDFFDEAARVLASPMPRRKAMRALGSAAAAAVLGALGVRPASAQTCTPACASGKKCCPGGVGWAPFCITQNKVCCQSSKCSQNQFCCTTGSKPFCRTAKKVCCGNKTCSRGKECCVNGRCVASVSGANCGPEL